MLPFWQGKHWMLQQVLFCQKNHLVLFCQKNQSPSPLLVFQLSCFFVLNTLAGAAAAAGAGSIPVRFKNSSSFSCDPLNFFLLLESCLELQFLLLPSSQGWCHSLDTVQRAPFNFGGCSMLFLILCHQCFDNTPWGGLCFVNTGLPFQLLA